MCRHPHERDSELSLQSSLGGKTAGVGCQSHPPGRAGFPQNCPSGRSPDPNDGISACWSQRSPYETADGTNPRRRGPQTLGPPAMTTSTAPYSPMQERVFAFLTDPATHPLVHRIDTHAASVFLEGDRALKIKRAVRFPFLDYSTLEKRKAACDEEIKINRPFAPQIYRRVIPITQGNDGSLDIGGDGTPVRSEEHTSELQSHVNLVCRLLLEKKKQNTKFVETEQNQKKIKTNK